MTGNFNLFPLRALKPQCTHMMTHICTHYKYNFSSKTSEVRVKSLRVGPHFTSFNSGRKKEYNIMLFYNSTQCQEEGITHLNTSSQGEHLKGKEEYNINPRERGEYTIPSK
jgi:hypothetical protein